MTPVSNIVLYALSLGTLGFGVGLVRPTFESGLRPTFGTEVRQTPLMLLRSKLFFCLQLPIHPMLEGSDPNT